MILHRSTVAGLGILAILVLGWIHAIGWPPCSVQRIKRQYHEFLQPLDAMGTGGLSPTSRPGSPHWLIYPHPPPFHSMSCGTVPSFLRAR
jgi:hypothetical protein